MGVFTSGTLEVKFLQKEKKKEREKSCCSHCSGCGGVDDVALLDALFALRSCHSLDGG